MTSEGGAPSPRRRDHLFLAGLLCGSLAVGAAGLVASRYIKSPAQAAAEAAPPPPSRTTVIVENRVLERTVISRGTVRAANSVRVVPTSGQDAQRLILTGLRVRAGQRVSEGQVVAEVSGRPVLVLKGAIPAYRDLRPGAIGPDVKQLQEALRSIGYSTQSDEDGFFGSGTKTALSGLYRQAGYDASTSAADEEERLSTARLQVRRAQRAVDDVRRRVREAASTLPPAGSTGTTTSSDLVDAVDALEVAQQDLYRLERSTGPMLPLGEAVFVPAFPVRVDRVTGIVGTQPRGAVLTLSTGALVVRGRLLPSEQALIRKGLKVQITSEVTGLSAAGVVSTIGAPGDDSSGVDGEAGQEEETDQSGAVEDQVAAPDADGSLIEVRGTKPLDPRLNGQDVRLTIVAASTGKKVLVVPLGAVSARADGSVQVVRVSGEGQETNIVVRAGTSGDGYLQVTPVSGRLNAGDLVVVGR